MPQVRLKLDGDSLVVELGGLGEGAIAMHLGHHVTVGDATALRDALQTNVATIEFLKSTLRGPELIPDRRKDWLTALVTCPCGKSFPEHGLGALGKHAAHCEQAKSIQIHKNELTIYLPVLEAITEWGRSSDFTVREMMDSFERFRVKISYSGIRTHLDHLVAIGKAETEKTGRSRTYRITTEVVS